MQDYYDGLLRHARRELEVVRARRWIRVAAWILIAEGAVSFALALAGPHDFIHVAANLMTGFWSAAAGIGTLAGRPLWRAAGAIQIGFALGYSVADLIYTPFIVPALGGPTLATSLASIAVFGWQYWALSNPAAQLYFLRKQEVFRTYESEPTAKGAAASGA